MKHSTGLALEYMYGMYEFEEIYAKFGIKLPQLTMIPNLNSKMIKSIKHVRNEGVRSWDLLNASDFVWQDDHDASDKLVEDCVKMLVKHYRMPEQQARIMLQVHLHFGAVCQHIAKTGLHELVITPEQALQLMNIKLDVLPMDHIMPHKSMFVNIPKEFFMHPDMKDYLDEVDYVLNSKLANMTYGDEHLAELKQGLANLRAGKDDAVVNLCQVGQVLAIDTIIGAKMHKDKPNQAYLSNYEGMFNFLTIEQQLDYKDCRVEPPILDGEVAHQVTNTRFYGLLNRIAIGACVISTIKNSVIDAAYSLGVLTERKRSVERISKTKHIVITDVRSSVILQTNMKSLRKIAGTKRTKITTEVSGETRTIYITRRPCDVSAHWRNQPYGEGRKLRRLKWIKQHKRNADLLDDPNPTVVTSTKMTHPVEVVKDVVNSTQGGIE